MSSLHQPRRRTLSMYMSNDNRKNTSGYGKPVARESSLQNKSVYGSLPPRVFIKPREEASQLVGGQTSARLARRASCVSVPTKAQPNGDTRRAASRTSGRKTTHLPRCSTSLHHNHERVIETTTATSAIITPAMRSKIPQSSSAVCHAQTHFNPPAAPAKPVANREIDGEVGHFTKTSSVCYNKGTKSGVTRTTKVSSPKNKENEHPRRQSTQPFSVASTSALGPEKRAETKRVFIRRKNSIDQAREQRRQNELSPRKVFLLPKVEEYVEKPAVRPSCSRCATVDSVASRSAKREKSLSEKSNLPSLPTIVMRHSPGKKQLDEERICTPTNVPGSGYRQPKETPTSMRRPRPFLLPRKPGSLPSSNSLGSIGTLPSQVLEHTPLPVESSCPPSESPCLSKARTKTIWTMLDEMRLIRSGGVVPGAEALAPDSGAHIVPLCRRFRSGANEPAMLDGRSPVRSSSTPYHLIVSSARRSPVDIPSALPPVPSITRAIALAEWENNAVDGLKKTNDSRKLPWMVVNVKAPKRRSTVSDPYTYHRGYNVSISTHDVTQKSSLLTRAQTFMKFRFSGSRKVVGRGDHWA